MNSVIRSFVLLGLISGSSGIAVAQDCPTPMVESDGFFKIELPSVTLKLRPGAASSDLELTQRSPLTGELETQRVTIRADGPVSERAALLQVNRYDFDQTALTISGEAAAVLAAGYTPTGGLNIGYGAEEGGFLVLMEGESASLKCLPYPEKAAFGEWTHALSVITFNPRDINTAFVNLKEELRVCRAQNSTLGTQSTNLTNTVNTLRERVRALEAELAREKQIAGRRIFDLSRVIRTIFNEAQDNVKRRYPGDSRALSVIRKQLVLARKANTLNIANSRNVVRANRDSVRR